MFKFLSAKVIPLILYDQVWVKIPEFLESICSVEFSFVRESLSKIVNTYSHFFIIILKSNMPSVSCWC